MNKSINIALLFPGQGSQQVGMGQEIALQHKEAQRIFEEADDILKFKLSTLCWNGPKKDLDDTYNTQPALYTCSMATIAVLKTLIPNFIPEYAAGHSLGEITALASMESMNFAQGLRLVRERGKLMKEAGINFPGGMAAILNVKNTQLIKICEEASIGSGKHVQIANDNCPGQLVISGELDALKLAIELVKTQSPGKAIRLPVSIAAHSPLMKDVSEQYRNTINKINFNQPITKIVGNAQVNILDSNETISNELVQQLTSPVRWRETIDYLIANNVTNFVEVGSGNVLTGLMRRINKKMNALNVNNSEAILKLVNQVL